MNEQRSYEDTKNGGILYLVPTPIGNLEDMTFRAIRILQEATVILAEDTRNTIKLLNHFHIETPMKSFHEHSRHDQIDSFIAQLHNGDMLALVSDAGMPLINDPGHPLVQRALAEQLSVVSLPGANAALTALVASGLPCVQFTYYGFFPRRSKEQAHVLQQVGQRDETAIFYESPHRIAKSMDAIATMLPENTQVVIARELTKRYETYVRGTVSELVTWLETHDIKGECVLLVQGGTQQASNVEEALDLPIKAHVEHIIATQQLSAKEAIKQVAKMRQLKKQDVYQAYHHEEDV